MAINFVRKKLYKKGKYNFESLQKNNMEIIFSKNEKSLGL